jgi:hypothetical protein
MRALVLPFMLLLAAAHALPAPSQLVVENLPEPMSEGDTLTISTLQPRFSFLAHAVHEHPGSGIKMSAYRIVVKSAGSISWDSGVVNASAAVYVPAGAELKHLTSYTWTAQWWAVGEDNPSPITSAAFDLGPGETEADWHGSSGWVGEGQNEFRYQFQAGAAVKLFVAAPGGSVVYVNGRAASDECGLSAWIDFSANLPYSGVNLEPFVTPDSTQTVVVKVGSGFYSGSKWRPNPNGGEDRSGGKFLNYTAARLLLVDAHGKPAVATLSGRVGGVVSVDPFVGGIFDTTLSADDGWAPTRAVVNVKKAGLDGPLRAFALPPAKTAPASAAALRSTVISVTALPPAPAPARCAQACDPTTSNAQDATKCPSTLAPEHGGCDPVTAPQQRWHYAFDRNIIGMAAVQPSAYKLKCAGDSSCAGEITVQYCEVFNNTNYTKARTPGYPAPQWDHFCQPLAQLSVVADTFRIGSNSSTELRPSFTWHGFQHVIVSVSSTVTFDPAPDSLKAEWTATNAQATGNNSRTSSSPHLLLSSPHLLISSSPPHLLLSSPRLLI